MDKDKLNAGSQMYELMQRLWPICRSITGEGVRQTLSIISEQLPMMEVHEVPTGTKCFDWAIPKEWNIKNASIIDPGGNKIVDFSENNLHIVNYSVPVDEDMEIDRLQEHLHSLPDQPNAIPYVTSYYKEAWGFCLRHKVREKLMPGNYHVKIDSELKAGSLSYGEIIIPGHSDKEVFISTYICHPSMANNELSGPCVTSKLTEWLAERDNRFTYRVIFVPETIGAICYLSKHLEELKEKVFAGYVINCVGDDRGWSFMPSRKGNTLSDSVARHVLKHMTSDYVEHSYLERGSDERQYCSPGIDLPVSSIMRSKYNTYPEYHTSLDNLDFVSKEGLDKSLLVYKKVIESIEADCIPATTILCEPKMSDRGLRPTLGKKGSAEEGRATMNILAYADGSTNLLDIAEIIEEPIWEIRKIVNMLEDIGLIKIN